MEKTGKTIITKEKVDKWNKHKFLNIGCGKEHIKSYINMDISNFCKPDIQHDIRKGFPMFEDSQFEEVLANGILEMIHPNEEFVYVMNELWRIIKPSGLLTGQVPSTDPHVMGLDPFDKRWFKEETFGYWDVDAHTYKTFGTQYGFKPWYITKVGTNDNGIICFQQRPANK